MPRIGVETRSADAEPQQVSATQQPSALTQRAAPMPTVPNGERPRLKEEAVVGMTMRPYEIETRGHVWLLNKDGEVDDWAYTGAGDYHNGPVCVNCGYGFCELCNTLPLIECETVIAEVPPTH